MWFKCFLIKYDSCFCVEKLPYLVISATSQENFDSPESQAGTIGVASSPGRGGAERGTQLPSAARLRPPEEPACRGPPSARRRPAFTAASVGGAADRGRRAARGRRQGAPRSRSERGGPRPYGSMWGARAAGNAAVSRCRALRGSGSPLAKMLRRKKYVPRRLARGGRAGFLCAPLPARAGRAYGTAVTGLPRAGRL